MVNYTLMPYVIMKRCDCLHIHINHLHLPSIIPVSLIKGSCYTGFHQRFKPHSFLWCRISSHLHSIHCASVITASFNYLILLFSLALPCYFAFRLLFLLSLPHYCLPTLILLSIFGSIFCSLSSFQYIYNKYIYLSKHDIHYNPLNIAVSSAYIIPARLTSHLPRYLLIFFHVFSFSFSFFFAQQAQAFSNQRCDVYLLNSASFSLLLQGCHDYHNHYCIIAVVELSPRL